MSVTLNTSIRHFLTEIRGATAIEYGVMAAVVAGIMLIGGNQFSSRIQAGLANTDAIVTATTQPDQQMAIVKKKPDEAKPKSDFKEVWELRD